MALGVEVLEMVIASKASARTAWILDNLKSCQKFKGFKRFFMYKIPLICNKAGIWLTII